MKLLVLVCTCLFITGALLNCSKRAVVNPSPAKSVDEQYEFAMNYFQAKNYDKAIDAFSNIIFNFPGSRFAADAQYYLALSYFEKKDYPQAIVELDFFVKNFPASIYIEPALVKLALAHLRSSPSIDRDQTQLLRAQELIEELPERISDSTYRADIENAKLELIDRLAHKDFNAANLYFRAREFAAAKIYYQHILDAYPQTSWVVKSKLPLAICYAQTGDKEKARQLLEELVKDQTNPELQKKAAAQLKKLE